MWNAVEVLWWNVWKLSLTDSNMLQNYRIITYVRPSLRKAPRKRALAEAPAIARFTYSRAIVASLTARPYVVRNLFAIFTITKEEMEGFGLFACLKR